jgi:tRNA nucleotidyltransferase (CCA-adding enzyme)
MPSPEETGQGRWELFAHDADIGVRGYGPTLPIAFENAARAMTAVAVDPAAIVPSQDVPVVCEAPDPEFLLVDWLNALVYESATRGLLFGDFRVRIEGGRLEAEARGEPIDPERHAPAVEVKGATYTALKVATGADGLWMAQCVIDV